MYDSFENTFFLPGVINIWISIKQYFSKFQITAIYPDECGDNKIRNIKWETCPKKQCNLKHNVILDNFTCHQSQMSESSRDLFYG
jgi:hypothetical protein